MPNVNIDDHQTSKDNHRWPQNYETCWEETPGRSSDFPIICPLVPLSCSRRQRSLSTERARDVDIFKLYARIDRSYKHQRKIISQWPFNTFTSVTNVSVDLRCMIFGCTLMIYLESTQIITIIFCMNEHNIN